MKTIIRNFGRLGIKPNEWSLYCIISYLATERKEMPPQDEIGHMLGLSERQVKQIIADLKKKGLLSVDRTKKARNKYNFKGLIDKAKQLDSVS
jgi:Mn-dependent DtxR family transcriptional regulator